MLERVTEVLSPMSLNLRPLKELLFESRGIHVERVDARRHKKSCGKERIMIQAFQSGKLIRATWTISLLAFAAYRVFFVPNAPPPPPPSGVS